MPKNPCYNFQARTLTLKASQELDSPLNWILESLLGHKDEPRRRQLAINNIVLKMPKYSTSAVP